MIETLLNLFRCEHRHLTRPVAAVQAAGKPHGGCYVVCLNCGKQFEYDWSEMSRGRPIGYSNDEGVVPPAPPWSREAKLRYAVLLTVPALLALGVVLAGTSEPRRNPSSAG